PDYNLSIWHGFNLPLVMSMLALVAGCAIYIVFAGYFSRCDDGPPWFRHLRGQRIFERVLVTVSWKWARFLESRLGTRSLQPQLRLVVAAGLLAGVVPLAIAGFSSQPMILSTVDPAFAAVWLVGAICAIGAAYQAKYHRL